MRLASCDCGQDTASGFVLCGGSGVLYGAAGVAAVSPQTAARAVSLRAAVVRSAALASRPMWKKVPLASYPTGVCGVQLYLNFNLKTLSPLLRELAVGVGGGGGGLGALELWPPAPDFSPQVPQSQPPTPPLTA